MGLANITIAGNLGSDPELRYTSNGAAVTTFNVAVGHNTKNQQTGEWEEETDWFRCTVWGDRAERAAEKLRKGNKVTVSGSFTTRKFTARDGEARVSLEIRVDNYQNQSPRSNDEGGSYQRREPQASQPVPAGNADIDDLPF